jgi:hypothetical protein
MPSDLSIYKALGSNSTGLGHALPLGSPQSNSNYYCITIRHARRGRRSGVRAGDIRRSRFQASRARNRAKRWARKQVRRRPTATSRNSIDAVMVRMMRCGSGASRWRPIMDARDLTSLLTDSALLRIAERFAGKSPNHHRIVWLVRKRPTPSVCSPLCKVTFQTRAVPPGIGLNVLFWKPAILKQIG